MKWTRFRIQTTTEAEDVLISNLYDLGFEGAQIEDKIPLSPLEKEQMFVDILPETAADDGVAFVSFFVETDEKGLLLPDRDVFEGEKIPAAVDEKEAEAEDRSYQPGLSGEDLIRVDIETVKERIAQEIREMGEYLDAGAGTILVDETEDLDWINNWKNYFHQFSIDDLLITPSWEEVKPEDADKKVLHIDPGTAFGTGMHETTKLCIRQIKKYLTGTTDLLDVGTGSGILGIVALMYGAAHITGTDLDPCALPAVEENLKANGIETSKFDMILGNIITDEEIQKQAGFEKYDMVVANILADVLVPLTPVITHQLKKGGIYITSGILAEKEKLVVEAAKNAGLEVLETTRLGEWVSVTAKKP